MFAIRRGYPDIKAPRPMLTETQDGHYDIVSYLALEDVVLPDSAVITCVLGIPSVNYNATKKIVHYPTGKLDDLFYAVSFIHAFFLGVPRATP